MKPPSTSVKPNAHNRSGSPLLQLKTLGRLELSSAGRPLLAGRRKVLALAVYLARFPGRTIRRERAAELLWGEGSAAAARQSLRQGLAELREVLGSALIADAETLVLTPGVISLDLALFEEDVRAGRFAAAVARWEGPFLDGLDDIGSTSWREWLEQERGALAAAGTGAFGRVVAEAEARGDWHGALDHARQWRAVLPGDADALAAEGRLLPLAGGLTVPGEIRALATPALTGREDDLARLTGAWHRVIRGEGRVVLVEGEAGHGTSRLLEEFARATRKAMPKATIVSVRGYAAERDEPHALTRAIILGLRDAPGLSAAPGAVLSRLRLMAPEIGERFPEAAGAPEDYPAPVAVHRALAEIAAESPVLVLVDDATTTDSGSLEVLRHLVRHPPGGCLVVLGGRPDAWGEATGGSDLRQAAGHMERVALRGLSRDELGKLIQSVAPFETGAAARLAERISREVGGAPGPALEILRLLVERGSLRMNVAGQWQVEPDTDAPLPLPAGTEARTRARLDRLTAVPRRLLDAAAVLGDPVRPEVLREVAGVDEATAADAIADLLARRWLRAPASDPGALGFTDEASHRVTYAVLADDRRRELHGSAAAVLEAAGMAIPHGAEAVDRHRRAAAGPHRRRGRRVIAVAAGVVALAAVIALAVRPPSPFPDGRARLLLADVEDRTGEGQFARSLGVAAAIALRESSRIELLSRDRVRETLGRMGRAGPDSVLDVALAREVAERDNLDAVMAITVDRTERDYAVTGALVAPAGGEVLAEAVRTAGSADQVVEALDDVLTVLRRRIGESRRITDARRRLPHATTASLKALRAYADGRRAWQSLDGRQALVHWGRAVELDSGFALALLALSDWSYWNNDRVSGEDFLRRALAHGDRLTERERLVLAATEAQRLGSPEEAAARLRVLAEAYPDRETWNNLAIALTRQDRCQEAIAAAHRSLGYDSLFANAWIALATCFQQLDAADSALVAYAHAEAARPGILYRGNLNQEWGRALVRVGDLAAAESIYTTMAAQDSPFDRPFGVRSLGFLAMHRGRYREAAGHFREAAALSRARDAKVSEFRNRVLLAEVLVTQGGRREAGVALDRAAELASAQVLEPGYHLYLGHALLRAGKVREAERTLQVMRGRVATHNVQDRSAERLLTGWIALSRGDAEAALAAVAEDRYAPYAGYRLSLQADALGRLGRPDSALVAARALATGFHFGYDSQDEWLRGWLRVADFAAATGDSAEARRALSAYLDRWPGGDADLPEVRQARADLLRLRGGSGR